MPGALCRNGGTANTASQRTGARVEILTRAAGSPGKHFDLCWLRRQGPSRGGDVDRITLTAQTDHDPPMVLHNRFRLSCGIEVRKGNEFFRHGGPYTSTRVFGKKFFVALVRQRHRAFTPYTTECGFTLESQTISSIAFSHIGAATMLVSQVPFRPASCLNGAIAWNGSDAG
jgi:hypothetical protein